MIIDKYKDVFHFNEVDIEHKICFYEALWRKYLGVFIVACDYKELNLNIPDNDGYYLIHAITMVNYIDYPRILIKQERLDPNVRLPDGTTAIHIAENNFLEIVNLLINNEKTDVNAINELGMTPIHYAINF